MGALMADATYGAVLSTSFGLGSPLGNTTQLLMHLQSTRKRNSKR
jgi:hypothetical protein